jgi:hypothetical protein
MTTVANKDSKKAKDSATQTVKVTTYTPGFIEGLFIKLAYKLESYPKLAKVSIGAANIAKGTKTFFVRTGNRFMKIGFTKTHLKTYGTLQLVNLAFFMQGLIGLVSLGLFSPSLTSKVTIKHARNIKDMQTYRNHKIIEKEIAEGKDVYNDLDINENNTTKEDKKVINESKVGKFQRDRVRRKNMTEAELDALLDKKLNNANV